MISEENKFKFINDEIIELSKGTQIRARYVCWNDWEFGTIFNFSTSLFKDFSNITIYFGKNVNDIWSSDLFLSKSYNFSIQFGKHSSQINFDLLPEEDRKEIEEYCNWIISEEGRNYIADLDDRLGIFK